MPSNRTVTCCAIITPTLVASTALAGLTGKPVTEVFDFEALPEQRDPEVVQVTGAHVGVTITSAAFWRVIDISGFGAPSSWGDRSLLVVGPSNSQSQPMTLSFQGIITAFSVQFGDFGADVDTANVRVFSGANGAGTQLASFAVGYDDDLRFNAPGLIAYTATDPSLTIGSVVIEGDGIGSGHSLNYDNLTVTTVPAPASTAAMLAMGLLSVRRRRV